MSNKENSGYISSDFEQKNNTQNIRYTSLGTEEFGMSVPQEQNHKLVDKYVKKITKIRNTLTKEQNISMFLDKQTNTVLLSGRKPRNIKINTFKDTLKETYNSLKHFQIHIGSILNILDLERKSENKKEKISIFRKELIRYNKKKFIY